MEEWRDIEGYEGKYQVSNQGNVKSLNFNNTGKSKIMKQKLNRYGYYELSLSKNNKKKTFLVSTLVANAFLGKKNPDMEAMHIGDTTQNNVENLKYGYRSQIIFNTYKRNMREGSPTRYKIGYDKKKYTSFSEIARRYNMKEKTLLKRIENGWALNEALSIPVREENRGRKKLSYKYYDKYMTLEEISKITGVSEKLILHRIDRGWNIYEAAEVPNLRRGRGKTNVKVSE